MGWLAHHPGDLETSALIKVDLIGVGTSVYDVLKSEDLPTVGVNVAQGTMERDATGYL